MAVTLGMLGCKLSLLFPEVLINASFVKGIVLLVVEILEWLNLRYFLPIKPTWVILRHIRELVLILTAAQTLGRLYDRTLP